MAPRRDKKRNAIIVPRESSHASGTDKDGGSSQEASNPEDNMRAAQEIVANIQQRRDVKKKSIETDHKQRIEKARVKIETLYKERKQKVSRSQTAQWDSLDALLKKRTSIETRIVRHVKNLEQIAVNLASEMDAVYAGRLEDIAEMDTTGKM